MNSKDKELLATLYELEQYAALKKFCTHLRLQIAEQMLTYDLTAANAERHVAFLQGQAFALDSLLKKVQEFHKQSTKD